MIGGGNVDTHANDRQQMLRNAHQLLLDALDLLDQATAPAQIGAHVDLAAHQLGTLLAPAATQAPLINRGRAAAAG